MSRAHPNSSPADSLPDPAGLRFRFIETQSQLDESCRHWQSARRMALDTEFVRERTFYAGLGLLQVNADGDIALIDPLGIEDLSPFADLLAETSILKILHSCSEDLEVFDYHLGQLPRPLFDTQVAATLMRESPPPGYARLIDELFDIDVPKGERRSNWLERPLREAQKRYAALDVAYLLAAQTELDRSLQRFKRQEWLREEMTRLLEDASSTIPDEEIYLSVGRARTLGRRQLAALRDLYAWRQNEARRRDLPRSFVMKDKVLNQLAARLPRRLEDFYDIEELGRRSIERHGRALLNLLHRVRKYPEADLPARLKRSTDISRHKPLVNRLRRVAQDQAQDLGLAPEVLANRRTIEGVVRSHLDGEEPLPKRLSSGWRFEALGQHLLAALP